MLPLGGGTSKTKVLVGIKARREPAVYRCMTRSFRSAMCAVSMFALAAGGANAQTLPATSTTTVPTTTTTSTTTTPSTAPDTFTLPEACDPSAPAATTSTTTGTTATTTSTAASATTTATDADQSLDEGLSACVAAIRTELASGDQHGLGEWVSQAAHDRADDAATTPVDQPAARGRGHGHKNDN
jgi:hypothetical protein